MKEDDFLMAMGESFSEALCPPVPFEEGSAHEFCNAVWSVLGRGVTAAGLTALNELQIGALAAGVGKYFGTEPPSREQIKDAIERTVARWPAGGDRS